MNIIMSVDKIKNLLNEYNNCIKSANNLIFKSSSSKWEPRSIKNVDKRKDMVVEINRDISASKYKVFFKFPVEYPDEHYLDFSKDSEEILAFLKSKLPSDHKLENLYFLCKLELRDKLQNAYNNFALSKKVNNIEIIDLYESNYDEFTTLYAQPISISDIKFYDRNVTLTNNRISLKKVKIEINGNSGLYGIYGNFGNVESVTIKKENSSNILLWVFSSDGLYPGIKVVPENIVTLFYFDNIWKPFKI